MAGRPGEVFYVLCLDSHYRVLSPALIGEGTVKEAQVEPRHLVDEALRHRASSAPSPCPAPMCTGAWGAPWSTWVRWMRP
jgi:hypothetical protein